MHDTLRAAFEEASRQQLQLAVNGMQGRPEVTDIWVYTTYWGGFLTSFVVYKTEGHPPVKAYDLDSVLTEPVGSTTEQWQIDLGDGVAEASNALFDAYQEADEQHPNRIVVHYDVRGQRMDASFSYNTLDKKILAPTPLFEKWLANGQQTGDMSADATTVPE